MAKQTVTLYLIQHTGGIYGDSPRKEVSTYDLSKMDHYKGTAILVGQCEVEIDFPEVDTRQLQIDALEQQIQKERADSQVRVNLLMDRISKLTAITHEVSSDE